MQCSVIIRGYQKPLKQTLKQFKIGIPLSWILSMPPLAHKSYGYIKNLTLISPVINATIGHACLQK